MLQPASLDERPYRLESRMRENRTYGSEGGEAQTNALSLPLSRSLCAALFFRVACTMTEAMRSLQEFGSGELDPWWVRGKALPGDRMPSVARRGPEGRSRSPRTTAERSAALSEAKFFPRRPIVPLCVDTRAGETLWHRLQGGLQKKAQDAFHRLYAAWPRILRPGAAQPLLVGHRGVFGHPEIRENGFEAFDLAISRGGALEMDLRLTSDGVVVVHHDPTLERVHGCSRRLDQMTFAELRRLAPLVPTLGEVLDRYGEKCPGFFLEVKLYDEKAGLHRLLQGVGHLLRSRDLEKRTTLISLDPRPLDAARASLPEIPRAYIYMVSPKRALAYLNQHLDTGILGWYLTFPETARPILKARSLLEGVGFANYRNTLIACQNRGFQLIFTDRIDSITEPP